MATVQKPFQVLGLLCYQTMKAAFVGFGELGLQIHALAKSLFSLDEVIVFDDYYLQNDFQRFEFRQYASPQFADFNFFVCLGYKQLKARNNIAQELLHLGRNLPSLVHPSSYVSETAVLSPAVYIYPMCNIDNNAHIGLGVLINNSVVVSHNSMIGNASYLSPGVVISGNVTVGAEVFLGSGAVASNGVVIGDSAIVGIATCISSHVEIGSHVIGNPMKKVTRIDLH